MTLLVEDISGKPIQALRQRSTQTVAVTASTAPSSAFAGDTTTIRVVCTVACHFKVGSGTPTATTSDAYLPADVIEYIGVPRGHAIALIRAMGATDGTAYVTEG